MMAETSISKVYDTQPSFSLSSVLGDGLTNSYPTSAVVATNQPSLLILIHVHTCMVLQLYVFEVILTGTVCKDLLILS